MKTTIPVLVIASLALAACHGAENGSRSAPPPSAAADNSSVSSSASADASSGPAAANVTISPAAPMLAMAYRLGLVIPAAQVRPLLESHQEACERAGSDQCQVLAAGVSAEGDERVSANLTLRATPAWMRVFRTRAEADATDLGGKIDTAATEGDDLSKQIVDTQAAQATRAAEKARLADLMQRRTKTLGDTLQVEQEITRVQGEMDQADSELAAMKGRVAMQTVEVSYASPAIVPVRGAAAPLAEAGRSFAGNFFGMAAVLVTIASVLLPFALVGAPIVWWLSRRKKRPAETPAA